MNHPKTMIHCPACETSLSVDSSYEGQRGKCPKCGERFVIRAEGSSQDDSAGKAQPKSSNRLAPDTSVQSAPSKSTTISNSTNTGSTSNSKSRFNEASIGKIGRFQLKEILGQGAFGRVYRAYDPQLDRMLALKVPIFHEDEHKKAARFEQEAKAAANLRHPNIVPVFDSGKVAEHYYIAAQFIDGLPLSGQLKKGAIPFTQAAIWARQIASALAYAHEMGIVHRDVKPHNVMLDSRNEPQLMDFGLAKRVNEDSSMTTEGSLLGTPAYMSPEQASGDVANVGPKSDQYAVGAVLFEMLTGKRVYDGPPHAVLAQILSDSSPSPLSIRPDVPRDLCAITLKAMNKSPEQRYASCKELALDLDRWLQGESVIARAPSFVERSLRIAKRNKAMTILSLGLMSVITISLIAVSWALIHAESSRGLAERNLETAKKQTQVANQQRDLAESEKRRAELAETNLLKKQESLQRSVYASRLAQIDDGWKRNRDAFRLLQQLDAIAVDPELKKLLGFEWYYWRNHLGRMFQELPLEGNVLDLAIPVVRGGCCFSEDGEWVLVCDSQKALIWKTASRELRQTIEFNSLPLQGREKLMGFYISSSNGVPKLLLNFQSLGAVQTALVIDINTKNTDSRIPDAMFTRIPGTGIALRQTDVKGHSYKTFPGGEPLGSTLKFDWTLVGFDANEKRRLILTPTTLEWRSLADDSVHAKLDLGELDKGRKVLDVSVSLPLRQILVNTELPNVGNSRQGFVLDLQSLRRTFTQKLNIQSGLLDTKFSDARPNALVWLNDSVHVTNDSRWYDLDAKSAFEKSGYSLGFQSRLLAPNADFSRAICVVGSKAAKSYGVLPILCSLQAKEYKFQYKREDDFFRNRLEDGPPCFACGKMQDGSLNVRLVQAKPDGSTMESKRTIKFPFRMPADANRRTYQILFGTRQVCALSRDGMRIHFFALDDTSDVPTRTILLNEEADYIILDPAQSRLAVSHPARFKEKRSGSINMFTGNITIVDLGRPETCKVAYEFYAQCSPEFDNSGRWLFLHNGSVIFGHKDDEDVHSQQFEDDVNACNRTKIYDSITGEQIVDIPVPEGQIATRTTGDANRGVFARGSCIYRNDGSKLCEVEDGMEVIGISSDGSRFITATSVVDATNGEVLLRLGSEPSMRFWLQGNDGYCVRENDHIAWFPFSTDELQLGTTALGSQDQPSIN